MLSLTSAHLYPFQVQPEPTDSTSPLISVQLPLCLQHTDMHAYIYKYLYSAQMSCQHGPIGCAAPPTVYSRSFNWSVVQHLTFSLFFFFFFFLWHTTWDQQSLRIQFLFHNPNQHQEQGWIYDITVCRLNSKETVRGQRLLEAETPVEAILARLGQANGLLWVVTGM